MNCGPVDNKTMDAFASVIQNATGNQSSGADLVSLLQAAIMGISMLSRAAFQPGAQPELAAQDPEPEPEPEPQFEEPVPEPQPEPEPVPEPQPEPEPVPEPQPEPEPVPEPQVGEPIDLCREASEDHKHEEPMRPEPVRVPQATRPVSPPVSPQSSRSVSPPVSPQSARSVSPPASPQALPASSRKRAHEGDEDNSLLRVLTPPSSPRQDGESKVSGSYSRPTMNAAAVSSVLAPKKRFNLPPVVILTRAQAEQTIREQEAIYKVQLSRQSILAMRATAATAPAHVKKLKMQIAERQSEAAMAAELEDLFQYCDNLRQLAASRTVQRNTLNDFGSRNA